MSFNPAEPRNGEIVDADLLRAQFNSLKQLIDAVPASAPALALDQSTPQTVTGGAPRFNGGITLKDGPHELPLSVTDNGSLRVGWAGGLQNLVADSLHLGSYEDPSTLHASDLAQLKAHVQDTNNPHQLSLESLGPLAAFMIAYWPQRPDHWAGQAPSTVAEALDRIAARLSDGGMNPV